MGGDSWSNTGERVRGGVWAAVGLLVLSFLAYGLWPGGAAQQWVLPLKHRYEAQYLADQLSIPLVTEEA